MPDDTLAMAVLDVLRSTGSPLREIEIERRILIASDGRRPSGRMRIDRVLRERGDLFRCDADGRWSLAPTAGAESTAERIDILLAALKDDGDDDEAIALVEAFDAAGFEPLRHGLYDWQREALGAWHLAGGHGVIEAITGAGKTRLGIAAIERHLRQRNARAAVVVPTIELQRQWQQAITEWFGNARAVGLRGGGSDDQLGDRPTTVYVARTAAAVLPDEVRRQHQFGPTLLIADEVHRLGADQLSGVLQARFRATLGLSATPERRYDDGMERHVFPAIGEVVYRYGYREGLEDDVIAPFEVGFIAVDFSPAEEGEYALLSKRIAKLSGRVRRDYAAQLAGRNFFKNLTMLAQRGEPPPRAYLAAIQRRRQIMLDAEQRETFVHWLVHHLGDRRAILFHETIDGAERSAEALRGVGIPAEAHHSALDSRERAAVLQRFATGDIRAVSAPRTLDEGIDVPEADIAVIVSGSTGQRQRIQRAGRVLRKAVGKASAKVLVVYVAGSREDPTARVAGDPFVRTIEDLRRARSFHWPRQADDLVTWIDAPAPSAAAARTARSTDDGQGTVLIATQDATTLGHLLWTLGSLDVDVLATDDATEILAAAPAARLAIVDRWFESSRPFPSPAVGRDAHRLLRSLERRHRHVRRVLLEDHHAERARSLGAIGSIERTTEPLGGRGPGAQRLQEALLRELVEARVPVAKDARLEEPPRIRTVLVLSESPSRGRSLAAALDAQPGLSCRAVDGPDATLAEAAGTDAIVVDVGSLSHSTRTTLMKLSSHSSAPILVLSDEYDSKTIKRLRFAGATAHRSKPVSIEDVSTALFEVIAEAAAAPAQES